MVYTGLQSLRYFTYPIYTILKNFTLIPISLIELYLLSSPLNKQATISLFTIPTIILSSILAAWSDITQTITELGRDKRLLENFVDGRMLDIEVDLRVMGWGYVFMIGNIVFTTMYIFGVKRGMRNMGFSEWDSKLYCLAFLFIYYPLFFQQKFKSNYKREV